METLYRKYRPKNFSEVEAQTHIVRTLKNAIASGRIGHAYLFTGPRGTGKTTVARIFSLALNCLKPDKGDPCGECDRCKGASLSTIEIDAASNTGVDNIRQLREEASLPPLDGATYKIYIIDEVHMLSKGAFNALLKILEEPPKHIIFILATTEIQKVPETIVSRCQRFDFGRLPLKNILEKLSRIATSEKVKLDPEVLEMVAIASSGGMRDAESLLSQLFAGNDKHITAKEAEEILGFSHRHTALDFISALVKNDTISALRSIGEASENGYDLDHFTETILHHLRRMLFLRVSPDLKSELENEMTEEELKTVTAQIQSLTLSWIVRTIDIFLAARIAMKSSFLPQIPLETAVVKIILPKTEEALSPTQRNDNQNIQTPSTVTPPPIKKEISSKPKSTPFTLEQVFPVWQQCIEQTAGKNSLLGTFLKGSRIDRVEGNTLYIISPSEFYKGKIENKENKLTIETILGILLNTRVSLQVSLEPTAETAPDSLMQDVMEAFGGTV